MSSLAVNTLMHNLAKQNLFTTKPPLVERHYSGPSGGGSVHHHTSHSSSSSSGGGKKHGIALSALTLLAFLFFLNILQNCLQDHMDQMTTPQVVIMQARIQAAREAEAEKRKGDIQPDDTLQKHSRINADKRKEEGEMSQIPIKLKSAADKSRHPG